MKELVIINDALVYVDEKGVETILWNKRPQYLSAEAIAKESQNALSEWNAEAAKYRNFVYVSDSNIIALVKDWKKVGTTKYGRTIISEEYGLERGMTAAEFYNCC